MSGYFFDNQQRCNYTRHNAQAAAIHARTPDQANRGSGVFTGLRVTTGPGLSLNISTGNAIVNAAHKSKNRTGISGVNNSFNFVVLTGAGTITRVTGPSTFPSFFTLLALAQASGGSFRPLLDLRTRIGDYYFLSPGRATAWRLSVATDGVLRTDSL